MVILSFLFSPLLQAILLWYTNINLHEMQLILCFDTCAFETTALSKVPEVYLCFLYKLCNFWSFIYVFDPFRVNFDMECDLGDAFFCLWVPTHPSTISWEDNSLPIRLSWHLCWKLTHHRCTHLFLDLLHPIPPLLSSYLCHTGLITVTLYWALK